MNVSAQYTHIFANTGACAVRIRFMTMLIPLGSVQSSAIEPPLMCVYIMSVLVIFGHG